MSDEVKKQLQELSNQYPYSFNDLCLIYNHLPSIEATEKALQWANAQGNNWKYWFERSILLFGLETKHTDQ